MNVRQVRRFPVLAASIALIVAASSSGAAASPEPPTLPGPHIEGLLDGAPGLDGPGVDPGGVSEPSASDAVVPGRYIVIFEDSVRHPRAVAGDQVDEAGGKLGLVYRSAVKGYSARLSKADVAALRRDPRVAYVTPDHKVEALDQTIPTGAQRSYATLNPLADIDGVDDIRVDADVAVLDTGVDPGHPDLSLFKRTNCVPAGEGEKEEELFVQECVDNTGSDGFGHGTHVAGIVGAIDNGEGVVGAAPGARLWSAKVLADGGYGFESWILAGVDWVTAHASEIEVANMSLGCTYCEQPALEEGIEASIEAGVVYVVAAGNEAINATETSPAMNPDVITVSAMTDYDGEPGGKGSSTCYDWGPDDQPADFSNWGEGVDIAAPGVCILSTVPGGEYAELSGTSMAAPYVAGAAAVIASGENPNSKSDVEAIRDRLVEEGSLNWSYNKFPDANRETLVDMRPTGIDATTVPNDVAQYGFRLNGVVNPGGLATTYHFQYGPTTSYGTSVPASPASAGSGVGDVQVSEVVTGLSVGDTYHYRVVATNGAGTVYGEDRVATVARWSDDPVPDAWPAEGQGSGLLSVSCATSSDCHAVGTRMVGEARYFWPLRAYATHWDGSSWSRVPVPMPPSPNDESELLDVSCSSSTACMAVGEHFRENRRSTTFRPFAVLWDGSEWAATSVPMPAEAHEARLMGVSCTSASHCVAVGHYSDALKEEFAANWKTMIAVWDGSEWSLQPSPNFAGVTFSNLRSVSCASSSSCVAVVGLEYPQPSGEIHVQRWNGSSWSIETLPTPPGFKGQLESVKCRSASFCVGAGYEVGKTEYEALVAYWNGEKWTVENLGEPGLLTDVDCPATDLCEATGLNYENSMARQWNGLHWTNDDAVLPGKVAALRGVSCPTAQGCVLAGYRFKNQILPEPVVRISVGAFPAAKTSDVTENDFKGNVTLNGVVNPRGVATSYWFEYGTSTSYGTKAPASPSSVGSGTSDIPVSQKVTGLSSDTTYNYRVVAISKNGTSYGQNLTFSTALPPKPKATTHYATETNGEGGTLVGFVNPEGAATTYQIEYGATTSYGSKVPASPKGVGSGTSNVEVSEQVSGLEPGYYHYRVAATSAGGTSYGADRQFSVSAGRSKSIACPEAELCFRVGAFGGTEGAPNTTVEAWDGSRWSQESVPLPEEVAAGGWSAQLSDISCGSSTSCVAVGTYSIEGGASHLPLVQRWDGSEWSLGSPVKPEGKGYNPLNGVSCSSAGACTAVGWLSDGGPQVQRWNGSGWSTQSFPKELEGDTVYLEDVSCPSAGACVAVGSAVGEYEGWEYEGNKVVAGAWNGTSWSLQEAVNPSNSYFQESHDVSCTSASACTMVGGYAYEEEGSSAWMLPLVQRWNGTSWAQQSTPGLAGASESNFNGVSCPTSTSCKAVGMSNGETLYGLVESWSGSTWIQQSTPLPEFVWLEGVSCSAASSCVATGYGSEASGLWYPVSAAWDGSEWTQMG